MPLENISVQGVGDRVQERHKGSEAQGHRELKILAADCADSHGLFFDAFIFQVILLPHRHSNFSYQSTTIEPITIKIRDLHPIPGPIFMRI